MSSACAGSSTDASIDRTFSEQGATRSLATFFAGRSLSRRLYQRLQQTDGRSRTGRRASNEKPNRLSSRHAVRLGLGPRSLSPWRPRSAGANPDVPAEGSVPALEADRPARKGSLYAPSGALARSGYRRPSRPLAGARVARSGLPTRSSPMRLMSSRLRGRSRSASRCSARMGEGLTRAGACGGRVLSVEERPPIRTSSLAAEHRSLGSVQARNPDRRTSAARHLPSEIPHRHPRVTP